MEYISTFPLNGDKENKLFGGLLLLSEVKQTKTGNSFFDADLWHVKFSPEGNMPDLLYIFICKSHRGISFLPEVGLPRI